LLAESRWLAHRFAPTAAALILLTFASPARFGMTPAALKELARALRLDGEPRWEWSQWNPLARIDVVSSKGIARAGAAPGLQVVTQDGGAPSLLVQPDPSVRSASARSPNPVPDPPGAPMLIIGLGGGPDLLAALEYAPRADVVEVNPPWSTFPGPFAEFVGDPLTDPAVNVTEGDGRFFVARSDDVYDVIQLTGVDTAVASAAGSPNLAENYLYTREAVQLYFDHLSPDGLLAVSFPNVEGMGLRLVNLVTQTLANAGVEHPEAHIVVSEITGYVHVLMKMSPFTEEELQALETFFEGE
jgi:hypothetical protein